MAEENKDYKWVYKPVEIKYPGGRCYCKTPGLKNNVTSWDFKGYYSSLMRTFNIGPDTLMLTKDLRDVPREKRPQIPLALSPYTMVNREVLDKFKDILLKEGVNCRYHEEEIEGYNLKITVPRILLSLKKEDVQQFYIDSQNWIDALWKTYDGKLTIRKESFHGFFFQFKKSRVSADGIVQLAIGMPYQCYFRQDFDSIVRIANETAAKERAIWRKLQNQWEEDGFDKDAMEWKHYNSEQLAYKLFGNIMYGQAGNIYSRIYAVACAMSITLAGQLATEWTRSWFEKNGMSVVYMDTDSNYVYDPKYSKAREARFIEHFNKHYQKSLWNYCEKTFAVKVKDNCIILEREKLWFRMMFLSKKRYVGIVMESDGKACWKLVARGVELRRTGTIQFAKDFQEEYYDMIFKEEIPDAQFFWDYIKRKHDEFYSLTFDNPESVEQITKRQKITMKIEDYKAINAQVNLMTRCKAEGEDLEIGDMLEYVLLKISDKQKKNYAETVERYLRSNSMLIHKDKYWDDEIFKPLFEQLYRLFPEMNWGEFDSENHRMAQKKYKAIKNRFVKKKLIDQKETIRIITEYSRFCKAQYIELLEMAKEKYKDVEDEDLHASIEQSLEYFISNEYLNVEEEEDDDDEN